jgi:hypothetical protein
MEMVLEEDIVAVQLLDRRTEGVLPPQPPGDSSECPIDSFHGPIAPQPIFPDHLLDNHRHRVRDRYPMTLQVFIDPFDELIQPNGAIPVPVDRQKVVIQDVNDNARIASSRTADEPSARAEDCVRVREKIGFPVMEDSIDDFVGKSALHISLDEISDEIPQHRCRRVVGADHMGEIIHEENLKKCIVLWCRAPGAFGLVLHGMRRFSPDASYYFILLNITHQMHQRPLVL